MLPLPNTNAAIFEVLAVSAVGSAIFANVVYDG
jgi:hypothetical protein